MILHIQIFVLLGSDLQNAVRSLQHIFFYIIKTKHITCLV